MAIQSISFSTLWRLYKTGARSHLTLLGVWAHVKEKRERYVRITHQAIDYYRALLTEERCPMPFQRFGAAPGCCLLLEIGLDGSLKRR